MSAAAILERLKAAGLALRPEGDKVIVSPRDRLSDKLLELIRTHKTAILRELAEGNAQPRKAISAVAASAGHGLTDFRAALVFGRLHVCCNCQHFTFANDPSGLGHCQRFDAEAWPFAVQLWCSGFSPSETPILPELLPIRQLDGIRNENDP